MMGSKDEAEGLCFEIPGVASVGVGIVAEIMHGYVVLGHLSNVDIVFYYCFL